MRLAHTIALACLAGAASVLPAAARTINVPQQYPTIQAALNAAKPGDTVQVSAKPKGSVYHETLTMSTPNVVLQGKNGATLDGTGLGGTDEFGEGFYVGPDGIDIRADHVAVRGLTVQNFAGSQFSDNSAIAVGFFNADATAFSAAADVEISGCTIRNNHKGITITGFNGDNPYYGTGTPTKGYNLLNNILTDNGSYGASVMGRAVLVAANKIVHNGFKPIDANGDGLDVSGSGIAITGNEIAGNYYQGVSVYVPTFNPAVNDPGNPNPVPSVVALNAVHDNGNYGIATNGTLTVSGNAVSRNVGYGLYLDYADNASVSFNSITQTAPHGTPDPGDPQDAGVGIYVYSANGLTLFANQISGNASDGIYLYEVDNSLVSRNLVTNNGGVGIDLDFFAGYYAPNTITLNTARGNAPYDAQDLGLVSGTGTANVWTRNNFGSANPPSLKN